MLKVEGTLICHCGLVVGTIALKAGELWVGYTDQWSITGGGKFNFLDFSDDSKAICLTHYWMGL